MNDKEISQEAEACCLDICMNFHVSEIRSHTRYIQDAWSLGQNIKVMKDDAAMAAINPQRDSNMIDYNLMAKEIHAQNVAVGWWDAPNPCM